jgi:hypothetical protein
MIFFLPWFQRFIFIIFIAKGERKNKPLEPGYIFPEMKKFSGNNVNSSFQ